MTALDKLVGIGSVALSKEHGAIPWDSFQGRSSLGSTSQLQGLFELKNGFVAFENALLVFPMSGNEAIPSLAEWNAATKWRRHYVGAIPDNAIFFAADAFASQFGLVGGAVVKFEPETGTVSEHSASIEDWAAKLLANYDYETGWSVAKEWQRRNGPLPLGCRLLGKRPFVLGGDYAPENLVAVEGILAMEKLGALFKQIRDVPDGQQITIQGWLEEGW